MDGSTKTKHTLELYSERKQNISTETNSMTTVWATAFCSRLNWELSKSCPTTNDLIPMWSPRCVGRAVREHRQYALLWTPAARPMNPHLHQPERVIPEAPGFPGDTTDEVSANACTTSTTAQQRRESITGRGVQYVQ